MKTTEEIIERLEDDRMEALGRFKDEPHKDQNHLATAYWAEFECLTSILEWIKE